MNDETLDSLKEQIRLLKKRLSEIEQMLEVMHENRQFLKCENQKLLQEKIETEALLRFAQEKEERITHNFVIELHDTYHAVYPN